MHAGYSSGAGTSGGMRRGKILTTLEDVGYASVVDLAQQFGVSEMTIRRDLRRMQGEGAVTVVHGGVHLPTGYDYGQRGGRAMDAKRLLAHAALDHVPEHGTILLDAGTTVMELVHALPGRFRGYAFTHSIPAISFLMGQPEINAYALGGDVRADTRSCVGPTTVEALSRIRADVGFLGAAALGPSGIYVSKDLERATKSAFIEASERTVLIVDHTKFQPGGSVRLCALDAVDLVLTDRTPHADFVAACVQRGVEVSVLESADA